MEFNKFFKFFSIGSLALMVLAPNTSFARWTFGDQVNLANNTLRNTISQLQQQIQMQRATGNPGFYMPIPYRQNDVFVFCKEGPNTQGQNYNWVPTDGVGGYTITNYSAYVYNPESWRSTAYYVTVCPLGAGPGNWQGTGSGGDYKGGLDYISPPYTESGPPQRGQKLQPFPH